MNIDALTRRYDLLDFDGCEGLRRTLDRVIERLRDNNFSQRELVSEIDSDFFRVGKINKQSRLIKMITHVWLFFKYKILRGTYYWKAKNVIVACCREFLEKKEKITSRLSAIKEFRKKCSDILRLLAQGKKEDWPEIEQFLREKLGRREILRFGDPKETAPWRDLLEAKIEVIDKVVPEDMEAVVDEKILDQLEASLFLRADTPDPDEITRALTVAGCRELVAFFTKLGALAEGMEVNGASRKRYRVAFKKELIIWLPSLVIESGILLFFNRVLDLEIGGGQARFLSNCAQFKIRMSGNVKKLAGSIVPSWLTRLYGSEYPELSLESISVMKGEEGGKEISLDIRKALVFHVREKASIFSVLLERVERVSGDGHEFLRQKEREKPTISAAGLC